MIFQEYLNLKLRKFLSLKINKAAHNKKYSAFGR